MVELLIFTMAILTHGYTFYHLQAFMQTCNRDKCKIFLVIGVPLLFKANKKSLCSESLLIYLLFRLVRHIFLLLDNVVIVSLYQINNENYLIFLF